MWATLVETGMMMYSMIVGDLSRKERESIYDDQKNVLMFFGVSKSRAPSTVDDFDVSLEPPLSLNSLELSLSLISFRFNSSLFLLF